MTLEEQLEIWHQNNEYQKIIDELERIPNAERGHELTGLLARAYENAAGGTEHPEYHLHAIELLESAVEVYAGRKGCKVLLQRWPALQADVGACADPERVDVFSP